jgi:hypothetical protein
MSSAERVGKRLRLDRELPSFLNKNRTLLPESMQKQKQEILRSGGQ